MLLPLTFLLASSMTTTLASPFLKARNVTTPDPPLINATITNAKSTDITSSFRIMLYREPQIVATSGLNGRWTTPGLARPQNSCTPRAIDNNRSGTFAHSKCHHENGITGSMQQYIVHCIPPKLKATKQRPSGAAPSDSATAATEGLDPGPRPSKMPFGITGMCRADEICQNGRGQGRRSDGQGGWVKTEDEPVAMCISRSWYVELAQTALAGKQGEGSLEGERVAVAASEVDGMTPLEAKGMDLTVGLVAEVERDGTARVQRSCTECVDLLSRKIGPDVDFLKTQATVVAATGVLWIAIMSG